MKRKTDNFQDRQALWHLVGGKLRAQLHAGGEKCPAPATLAAYFDRKLTAGERALVEAHLTGCGDCQEHLAEIARLTETQEQPIVIVEPEYVPAPVPSRWGLRLAWLAPLILTVLVVGLWYPNELRRFLKLPPVPTPSDAVSETAADESAQTSTSKAPEIVHRRVEDKLAARQEAPAPGEPEAEMKADAREPSPDLLAKKERAEGPGVTVLGQRAARDEVAEGAAGVPSAPALTVKQGARRPARVEQGDWRVGRLGLIQKARSDGEWMTIPSGVRADLFDITFPTPLVGWAVGAAGTVLRTTDGGKTWMPTKGPGEEDLVRVSASDARSARVVTRTGRAYATSNGGASWNEFQLN
jgi:hypothetical protein